METGEMSVRQWAAERAREAVKEQIPADVYALGLLIYLEARGESEAGRLAVAQVVRNRVRKVENNPRLEKLFGKGWLGVLFKALQFSCFNQEQPVIAANEKEWPEFLRLSRRVYYNFDQDATGCADHYHAIEVQPDWAEAEKMTVQIGGHVFYRLYDWAGRRE